MTKIVGNPTNTGGFNVTHRPTPAATTTFQRDANGHIVEGSVQKATEGTTHSAILNSSSTEPSAIPL